MQRQLLAAIASCALAIPAAAQRLEVNPFLPTYGQAVAVELKETSFPMYLPATRYTRSGSSITIDYEYVAGASAPSTLDFGGSRLSLGELAAGNYTVQARLHDIANPGSAPKVVNGTIAVAPPSEWGIYTVPREPQAYAPVQATIRSAAYFEPASMRVTLSGNVVRVEFAYRADAPAFGSTPAGLSTFGSVALPPLAPGDYRVEGWGRNAAGGEFEKFFTRDVRVASTVPVVEFYSPTLDHYFLTAGPEEIAALDRGQQGDWKRTGQSFLAWARASDAPPGSVAVCRFYARGPNSHFYTGSKEECDGLKALEHAQRADAAARGQPFLGWAFEAVAFYTPMPQGWACPYGLRNVFRAYNNRASQSDANHRFMVDPFLRDAMAVGWVDEGAQLCGG
jgi:hypothetical protein